MSEAVLIAIIFKICVPYLEDRVAREMCVTSLVNCSIGSGGLIMKQDAFQKQCIERLPTLMEREYSRAN